MTIDGREVVYEPSMLDELTLAYACTIHKSQGSEYPCVIVPLHTQHYLMLQRNLLYTAITRAKRLAILVGEERALASRWGTGREDPIHSPCGAAGALVPTVRECRLNTPPLSLAGRGLDPY